MTTTPDPTDSDSRPQHEQPSAAPADGQQKSAATMPSAAPVAAGRSFRHRRLLGITGAASAGALVLGLSFAAGAATGSSAVSSNSSTTIAVPAEYPQQGYGYPYRWGQQQGTSGSSSQTAPVDATGDQLTGVVTIVSEIDYGAGEAAGTGIVLTSDGTILTNNHVIEGATSIEVTVESTGQTYSASVVGYDETEDVAVLQLDGASGLQPATLDPSEQLSLGDAVTSVGNADGTGTLVAASGTVSGLGESITAGDASGGDSEQLTDLIEIDAYVVSGDSGGPLLDSDGEVVGIVTAASSGTAVVTGYAIDIDVALAVWQQVESGQETDTVQIGLPAFLGIALSRSAVASGALIGGVVDGSPAASAGLAGGDTITAIDGVPVSTPDQLSTAIAAHEPGETVSLSFTDASGLTHEVTVTLAEGPAA